MWIIDRARRQSLAHQLPRRRERLHPRPSAIAGRAQAPSPFAAEQSGYAADQPQQRQGSH